MLTEGSIAPNFSLEGDDLEAHSLHDFRGRNVVIFFYPKDLTPGCTTEACDFTAFVDDFSRLNTQVIGISKDSLASHARFKSKYSLRTLLLSDPDCAVHRQYGAFGEKTMYGKTSLGVIRSTFLLDDNGIVLRSWYKVRVKNHVKSVLDALKNAEGGTRTRTG